MLAPPDRATIFRIVGRSANSHQFRVVDLRADNPDAVDVIIEGVRSPEEAAQQALGLRVVRSGSKMDRCACVLAVSWPAVDHGPAI